MEIITPSAQAGLELGGHSVLLLALGRLLSPSRPLSVPSSTVGRECQAEVDDNSREVRRSPGPPSFLSPYVLPWPDRCLPGCLETFRRFQSAKGKVMIVHGSTIEKKTPLVEAYLVFTVRNLETSLHIPFLRRSGCKSPKSKMLVSKNTDPHTTRYSFSFGSISSSPFLKYSPR